MDTTHLAALRRSLAAAASRRGLLAGLTGGLLVSRLFAAEIDETEAKKRGKDRKKRLKRKNKNRNKKNGAVTRVDATCNESTDAAASGDGNGRLAQTFTALTSGALVRAELLMEKKAGEDGDYVLRLSSVDGSNVPTNEVLAEATAANDEVPVGRSTVVFDFANPFSVEAGAEYALVLTQPGGDRFTWNVRSGDLCSGSAFVSSSQTGRFTENLGDFIFTTFVRS